MQTDSPPKFAPLVQTHSLLPTTLPQASVLAEDTKDSDSVILLEVLPLSGSRREPLRALRPFSANPASPTLKPPPLPCLPPPLTADYGFDPLGLSKLDLFPAGATDKARAPELVLRDYRDAELRHGRLAMLAALAWPVQVGLVARLFDSATLGPCLYSTTIATHSQSSGFVYRN